MNLFSIDKTKCNNCYKCLRACPTKAIRMLEDSAEVVEDRCIFCGKCRSVCPQQAITASSDLFAVKQAIAEGRTVVASVAPSFAGSFGEREAGQVPAALSMLGFSRVEETASGAALVTGAYREAIEKRGKGLYLSSSCPGTVNLIQKYYPDLSKRLIGVKSPMLAHGEFLKFLYGRDAFVVFVGPCIAKKKEAEDSPGRSVDAVLTFEEIEGWLADRGIEVKNIRPRLFDSKSTSIGAAYPLKGGITGGVEDIIACRQADGIEEARELLEWLQANGEETAFVEISLCRGSCINGPAMPADSGNYYGRENLVACYRNRLGDLGTTEGEGRKLPVDLSASYPPKAVKKAAVEESEIRGILRSMWKRDERDELNCEACGYANCREKAAAVYEGMAETSMCLPFMRARAESLKNIIFDNSPNIVFMLDSELAIKEMNPRAEAVFQIGAESWKGRPIGELIDDSTFREVVDTQRNVYNHRKLYSNYGVTLLESVLYIEDQEVVLGIMTDVTRQEKHQLELAEMKANTIDAAQKVIDKQMRVAQEIASLLGETTAETKVTLMKLKKLSQKEGGGC